MNSSIRLFLIGLGGFIFLAGCAAPVQILLPPTEPLAGFRALEVEEPKNEVVGQINRGVIGQIMEEAVEGVLDLKHFDTLIVSGKIGLRKELSDRVIRTELLKDSTLPAAVLRTTLVEYDEGSGALRFFFGIFAGTGSVTLELTVLNRSTQQEVMKARTRAEIVGAFSTPGNVVGPLSKAIVNFVEDHFAKPGRK